MASGVSDVASLYFNPNTLVSIEGSRNLYYRIKERDDVVILKTGRLKLIPQMTRSEQQYSDLVRLEAYGEHFTGRTLDLDLISPSELTLIEGTYTLASYISGSSGDGERRRSEEKIKICEGCNVEKRLTIYMLPKQADRIAKEQDQRQLNQQKLFRQKYSRSYHASGKKPVF